MTACPGTKIKELRILSGMSQDELGKKVGVQRAAINKYEKGTVTNIPIVTIERIAEVFDVSPVYLLGWDDTENVNPLSLEVNILQGVKTFYGNDAVDLLEMYTHLNTTGRKRAHQYLDDLERIDDYHD